MLYSFYIIVCSGKLKDIEKQDQLQIENESIYGFKAGIYIANPKNFSPFSLASCFYSSY